MKKLLALLITLPLLFAGCRTTKPAVTSGATQEWQQLSIPFKLSIDNGISASGKGYFVNGESIYLSVRYFGMEVISLYADTDSVFLYDKTHSTLLECELGINPVTHKKLTIDELQNILVAPNNEYSRLNLHLQSLNINLEAYYTDIKHTVLEKWVAAISDASSSTRGSATLTWNLDKIDTTIDNLPKWKRPAKPKRIVGLNELYYIIANQI